MDTEVIETFELRFGSGDPVRSASGVAPFAGGWLIAQDDAVHAAWWRTGPGTVEPVRVLPARGGHETFAEQAGTKHLKPDLEAACRVPVGDGEGVLMLGSGSLLPRTIGVLVSTGPDGRPASRHADLAPLYEHVRKTMELGEDDLNLEGACVVGDRLRWFQRGLGHANVPSSSVDLDLAALLAVFRTGGDPGQVECSNPRRYDIGGVQGVSLAVTDAVSLADGRVCVSATAEDTHDPVRDGPVLGSALALLGTDGEVLTVIPLPGELGGWKIEGLAVAEVGPSGATLLAVADQDDPDAASRAARLRIRW